MTKRIASTEARLTAQTAAQKATEIQAHAEAHRKLVNSLWNKQRKIIICSAVDGNISAVFSTSLAEVGQLERAGFVITETIRQFPEKKLQTLESGEDVLSAALDICIENFISQSKERFQDGTMYANYVRNQSKTFLTRAKRIQDTADDFALLKYLNSESYKSLGCDGGFDEFSSMLIHINRIMHMIVDGGIDLSKNPEKRQKQIYSLMPSIKVSRTRIRKEILEAKNNEAYFTVSWKLPTRSKEKTESMLTADRMAWLVSKRGQDLMNFVFGRIEMSVASGAHSVEFCYRTRGVKWRLDDYNEIDAITIDHLEEILDAKGYHVKKLKRDHTGFVVGW